MAPYPKASTKKTEPKKTTTLTVKYDNIYTSMAPVHICPIFRNIPRYLSNAHFPP